jgi:hypothetical protein
MITVHSWEIRLEIVLFIFIPAAELFTWKKKKSVYEMGEESDSVWIPSTVISVILYVRTLFVPLGLLAGKTADFRIKGNFRRCTTSAFFLSLYTFLAIYFLLLL